MSVCSVSIFNSDGTSADQFSITGQNAVVYGNVDRVDYGLPLTTGCRSLAVYVDNCEISAHLWE
jgi:hypothetical protein